MPSVAAARHRSRNLDDFSDDICISRTRTYHRCKHYDPERFKAFVCDFKALTRANALRSYTTSHHYKTRPSSITILYFVISYIYLQEPVTKYIWSYMVAPPMLVPNATPHHYITLPHMKNQEGRQSLATSQNGCSACYAFCSLWTTRR